jgi:hypothetical protein
MGKPTLQTSSLSNSRIWLVFATLVLSSCSPLSSIPSNPPQTPENWLKIQPFIAVKLGAVEAILVQPSSTFFVYLLGILAVAAGVYILRIREGQRTRLWWGIALILWGLGALFAGTSYQAFSYEIKCRGREICSWTSGWEVIYLLSSVASVDAMMMAEAYVFPSGKWRKGLIGYALANIALYAVTLITGVLSLNKFLISFELLLLVTAPSIVALLVLSIWRYAKFRDPMDLGLMITWIWLGLVIDAYFTALQLGITEAFWEKGFWFSENDVLHIGLISWMLYIAIRLAKRVHDSTTLS